MTATPENGRANPLATVRAGYAEDLRIAGGVKSAAVVRAFATVPREQFLGPGPWPLRGSAPLTLAATSLGRVGLIPFIGARDPAIGEALAA